jgi:hypothetical protein
MPLPRFFPFIVAIAFQIDRFWRYKDIYVDEVALATRECKQERVRANRRCDM